MSPLDPIGSSQTASTARADTGGQGRTAAAAAVKKLSEQQLAEINQLKVTDRHVRAHEQAHLAAGSIYVRGGASFGYTTGPDGNEYATSGEVSIDASPGNTPKETVDKARVIQAAALAPADPSPQDRAVAAAAATMEMQAAIQLAADQTGKADSAPGGRASISLTPVLPRVGFHIDTAA